MKKRLFCLLLAFMPVLSTGCAVTEALGKGHISTSRYDSYVKMCEEAEKLNEWEFKEK